MVFVLFAALVITWSLLVLLGRRAARWIAYAVLLAASASIALDVRAILDARRAHTSHLSIRVVRRDAWWQLRYQRDGIAFLTANELHVPIGTVVDLEWRDLPPPWIDGAICVPRKEHRCALIASRARSHRIWHPKWWSLRVIADPPAQFERWFQNEARPARGNDPRAFVFTNSGCSYCHVIRGVAMSASTIAPDLTHFASRHTVRAVDLAGWIADSRGLKRDSAMPPNRLDAGVLHTVVSYVESLR